MKNMQREEGVVLDLLARERRVLVAYIKEQKDAEKAMLLSRVGFRADVFALAVKNAEVCEHVKCKAWGDAYGSGVLCMVCGKVCFVFSPLACFVPSPRINHNSKS
jgi:hypothetical protein